MIYFTDWRLDATGDILARQYDNESRTLTISGALPEGWVWELLVRAGDAMDIWPLEVQEGGIGCTLTAEMLAVSGYYTIQLRGTQGEKVRHTNTLRIFIPESLSGDAHWPEIPAAFSDAVTQAEGAADRAEAAAAHQPAISDAKTWLVWDAEKGTYVDTGVSAGGESADWVENDETAPGYIKNRPFYAEQVESPAVDVCSFSTHSYMLENIELSVPIEVGREYNIYLNGNKVNTSVCKQIDDESGSVYQISLGTGILNTPIETPQIGLFSGPPSERTRIYRIEQAAYTETVFHTLDVSFLPKDLLDALDELVNMLDTKMSEVDPTGSGTLSVGRKTDTESGGNSIALGTDVEASGYQSYAEGNKCVASGNISHAEGSLSKATGLVSHAEGLLSEASGGYSHAEGSNSKATGDSSHAEGGGCQAAGRCSHAEGLGTIAASANQHVSGCYNVKDPDSTFAVIVGNGADDNTRGNAFTLDWGGNAEFSGDVAARAVILLSSTEGSGKAFALTVSDDGVLHTEEL